MTSDTDIGGADSSIGGDFELWAEQTVDIETPFSNKTEDDVDYLKLEVAELKQILISLAEKYKLSEDRRKVAERRNSFLKADNQRLQQASDMALSQKIEAEIDNRKTLDKLREFIDFKQEFEKQAELLKKIISHLPRMKNACTSTRIESYEKALQCSGDTVAKVDNGSTEEFHVPFDDEFDASVIDCSGDNTPLDRKQSENLHDKLSSVIKSVDDGRHYSMSSEVVLNASSAAPKTRIDQLIDKETKEMEVAKQLLKDVNSKLPPSELSTEINPSSNNEPDDYFMRSWDPKHKKAVSVSLNNIKADKSKINMSKLKKEVLALKNLNEWKTSDLDYKNHQLAVKNRELLCAKKEITQLKLKVNSLLVEQQKRPSTSSVNQQPPPVKLEPRIKTEKPSKEILRIHQRETAKGKTKPQTPPAEAPSKRKQNAETIKSSEVVKHPLSNEIIWKEIAPGDHVKIRVKKHG